MSKSNLGFKRVSSKSRRAFVDDRAVAAMRRTDGTDFAEEILGRRPSRPPCTTKKPADDGPSMAERQLPLWPGSLRWTPKGEP